MDKGRGNTIQRLEMATGVIVLCTYSSYRMFEQGTYNLQRKRLAKFVELCLEAYRNQWEEKLISINIEYILILHLRN